LILKEVDFSTQRILTKYEKYPPENGEVLVGRAPGLVQGPIGAFVGRIFIFISSPFGNF
jgi:hypothetical protein